MQSKIHNFEIDFTNMPANTSKNILCVGSQSRTHVQVVDSKGDSVGKLTLAIVWRRPLKSEMTLEDEEQRLKLSAEEVLYSFVKF